MTPLVTQAHREMAYSLIYGGEWEKDLGAVSEYVRSGTGGEMFSHMSEAAQIIANFEAKVSHKAWNEGCSAGSERVNFATGGKAPSNPYPKV